MSHFKMDKKISSKQISFFPSFSSFLYSFHITKHLRTHLYAHTKKLALCLFLHALIYNQKSSFVFENSRKH